MAHGITESDNMVYNGLNGKPWHGLGVELDGLATMNEVLAAVPALGASVKTTPVPFLVAGASQDEVDGKFITYRDGFTDSEGTTHAPHPLGVVGSKYSVLQNADAFRFFDKFTADPNGPKYETAGTLWGGRKVFIFAKLPDVLEVVPGDIIEPFILLSNSHDGSSAVQILETPIRVVCQNTLNQAIRQGKEQGSRGTKLRHSGNILQKVDDVREALGIVREQFQETLSVYQDLAKKEPTKEQVEEVLQTLFPETKSARSKNQQERVMALWERGAGAQLKGVRGTAWGLYNAVTELTDHYANQGSKREDAQDMRVNNILFGSGKDFKEEALTTIRSLVGV